MRRKTDSAIEYRIELEERCGCWLDQLTGLKSESGPRGTTLRGSVRDQAALHGVLRHIRDLGLTLVSLVREGGAESDVGDSE